MTIGSLFIYRRIVRTYRYRMTWRLCLVTCDRSVYRLTVDRVSHYVLRCINVGLRNVRKTAKMILTCRPHLLRISILQEFRTDYDGSYKLRHFTLDILTSHREDVTAPSPVLQNVQHNLNFLYFISDTIQRNVYRAPVRTQCCTFCNNFIQGRSHVSKIGGVYLFFLSLNVQLQRPKASRREEWERVVLPSRLGCLGAVVSSPSGIWGGALAANDFGTFRAQFYAILRIF